MNVIDENKVNIEYNVAKILYCSPDETTLEKIHEKNIYIYYVIKNSHNISGHNLIFPVFSFYLINNNKIKVSSNGVYYDEKYEIVNYLKKLIRNNKIQKLKNE